MTTEAKAGTSRFARRRTPSPEERAPATNVDGGGTPARVIFFGSGEFAVPVLESIRADPTVELVAVVSVPDRPAGRSGAPAAVPVVNRARALGLPIIQPARLKGPDTVASLERYRADVAVLADYGRIVPPDLLAVPRRGFLNLHPSLLPRHRGASPIAAAILGGDQETGVTVFQMDQGMDTGPILAAERLGLSGAETARALEVELATLAAELLGRCLGPFLAGTLVPVPQGEGATVTRPLRREDGHLDPARPARELERQVRALQPWPGSFVETSVGRLVVWAAEAEVVPGAHPARPGLLGPRGLDVADGLLVLREVQLAGARRMTWEACTRGRPALVGSMTSPVSDVR